MQILQKLGVVFTRSQKRRFFLLFFLILIGGLLETLGVSVLMPVIMVIINPDSFRETLASLAERFSVVRWVSEVVDFSSNVRMVLFFGILLIAIYVIKAVFQLWIVYRQNRFISHTRNRVRTDTMQSIMTMPYESYLTLDIPSVVALTQRDIPNAFGLVLSILQLFSEAVVAVFICAFLLYVNPVMTLLMIVLLLVLTVLITKVLKPRLNRFGMRDRECGARSFKWLSQGLYGLKDVRILHREQYLVDRYYETGTQEARAVTSYAVLNSTPRTLIETVFIVAILSFMMFSVLRGDDSTMLMSHLTAFGVAAMRLMPGVNRINTYLANISFYEPALNILYEHKCKFRKLAEEGSAYFAASAESKLSFQNEIVMSHITYRYPDSEVFIFRDGSLRIPRGASVGIQGTSGAGKSTLVDILLGLLPVESGEVLCDGVNVFEHYAEWLAQIGYIPQSIYLTDETIRENVGFGMPPEQIDDERVWDVLKQAQLDEFVRGLKDGLDTVVGERGIRLSGGQRQRIGIARALYHDPEILVFDEATSALDNETEAALMESIESFHGQKTMLIIAHRLHTIENCDIIYVVGDGTITKKE